MYPGHTPEAARLTRLFLQSFRFNGALIAAGDRLTAPVGLTAARWQVLSMIARADRPETVANIGRIMGLSRQAVQRIVNELTSDGLLHPKPNPHHKRATLICLTDHGRLIFEAITARQVPWVNALSKHLAVGSIEAALEVLTHLTRLLSEREGEPRGSADQD